MTRSGKRVVVGFLAMHTLLLACYTFPERLVPERLRVIGQFYARPLFHQQWRLFAPDPPLCSCRIEYSVGGSWFSIFRGTDHYLQRRAAQTIAHHVQAEAHKGRRSPAPQLMRAMRTMALHGYEWRAGYAVPTFQFRLVEHCVSDIHRPWLRNERITNLAEP
ncbi:MAG: hypothetical protein IPK70_08570 [Flavobacteriales bacterium]|nr:hypothetical protein [Flavobacteriales bacterium]